MNDIYMNNNVLISCNNHEITDISIAEGITIIGNKAFSENKKLKCVELPQSLKIIGNHAFENCHALKIINLPNSITSIGNFAFHQCYELDKVYLPNQLCKIGTDAFSGCPIHEIIFPDTLTFINIATFAGCRYLNNIQLNSNIEEIGKAAFIHCTNLNCIRIMNPELTIGKDAFLGCQLDTIIVPEESEEHFVRQFKNAGIFNPEKLINNHPL